MAREFEALKDVIPEDIRARKEKDEHQEAELVKYCLEDLKPFKLNGKEKLNPHGKRVVETLV